jgi:hypothetical protein
MSDRSYTAAEILAFSRMSWWEHAAREGLPTRVGPRTIEVGYRSQAERDAAERRQFSKPKAKAPKKPAYDYLSDDWRL